MKRPEYFPSTSFYHRCFSMSWRPYRVSDSAQLPQAYELCSLEKCGQNAFLLLLGCVQDTRHVQVQHRAVVLLVVTRLPALATVSVPQQTLRELHLTLRRQVTKPYGLPRGC